MIGLPKPRPHLLEQRDAKNGAIWEDGRERQRCHARSGMRCEVRTWTWAPELARKILLRCKRRVTANHHLIGGWRRRNRAQNSIDANARLDVCQVCHQDIHGHVLKPVNEAERYDASLVTYERTL